MNYDKESFLAGLAVGLSLWRPQTIGDPPYISFTSDTDFTLETVSGSKIWDGTMEYSTDGITWTEWDGTEISSNNGRLFLRGNNNTFVSYGKETSSPYASLNFRGDDLAISLDGNIENLLDWQTVKTGEHPAMASYAFCGLFDSTPVITPPKLPAMQLAPYCYYAMFSYSALTEPPELPATQLAVGCYASMFEESAITTAPLLPALVLEEECYSWMFFSCYNLTEAPKLPAMQLAPYCYEQMFKASSITKPPALPATQLSPYCYSNMFAYTSFTELPSLPAQQLAEHCYDRMFFNCYDLKVSQTQGGEYQHAFRIPASGTGTDAAGALYDMFTYTAGTFTGTPAINTTYYTDHAPVS